MMRPHQRLRQGDEPWQVGVLFSLTGFMSVIEETQLCGTLMAIDEINAAGGILGRELIPVFYNPGSDAFSFAQLTRQLIVEDKVSTIFGGYMSSCRKTVVPMLERLNALLWYPTTYEGFEASPSVIYTGSGPNQNILNLCQFLLKNYGNRFYLVGSNYVYAHAVNRLIKQLLHGRGVVVGESYVGLQAKHTDFMGIINDIRYLQPDVIFSTTVGAGTICLYQTYCDAGFNTRTMPIASLTATEAEIQAMEHGAAEGHLTAAAYFQSVESEANRHFIARYKKRFGSDAATNMCVEAAYYQVHLFAKALTQAQTMECDALRNAAAGLDFAAPQGNIHIDRTYTHANVWSRIGRVNHEGEFDILNQSRQPINADPFLVGTGPLPTGLPSRA